MRGPCKSEAPGDYPVRLPLRPPLIDATRLTLAGRIATGAVSHIGGSEGFSIGCRSRHNFLQNIGRRFLPYKVMNLFPGRVLGRGERLYGPFHGLKSEGRISRREATFPVRPIRASALVPPKRL
ncbi:hypothetical protein EVAR_28513_1 [Eumeta japonica]|uniref:Uncharacterized protein n=1 Tax=Eumeta variegata TaxID=151549 RepID=A0A4C1WPG8_EUMVA|nr:hypothetical protein EVAR_28513_1 [Eumeta japonica]